MNVRSAHRVLLLLAAVGFSTSVVPSAAQGTATPPGSMPMARTMSNDFRPFTPAAFKAAQDSGQLSLVFFHAPWCPVCRAQEPKLVRRLNDMSTSIVALKVDYDSNQMLRTEMNVSRQSTVILYRGAKEIARLSYTSDDAALDELFRKTAQTGTSGM